MLRGAVIPGSGIAHAGNQQDEKPWWHPETLKAKQVNEISNNVSVSGTAPANKLNEIPNTVSGSGFAPAKYPDTFSGHTAAGLVEMVSGISWVGSRQQTPVHTTLGALSNVDTVPKDSSTRSGLTATKRDRGRVKSEPAAPAAKAATDRAHMPHLDSGDESSVGDQSAESDGESAAETDAGLSNPTAKRNVGRPRVRVQPKKQPKVIYPVKVLPEQSSLSCRLCQTSIYAELPTGLMRDPAYGDYFPWAEYTKVFNEDTNEVEYRTPKSGLCSYLSLIHI